LDASSVRVVVEYYFSGIFLLDSWARLARLAGPTFARQMLLTDFLAVAHIADLPWLGFRRNLADAVLANEVRRAAVRCIAQVSFTAKHTVTLLRDVRVQRDVSKVRQACGWCWEILGPVEV
jgi:hypothetical protein